MELKFCLPTINRLLLEKAITVEVMRQEKVLLLQIAIHWPLDVKPNLPSTLISNT